MTIPAGPSIPPHYSVVVPVYRGSKSIGELRRRLSVALEPLGNSPAQFAERMKADYTRYADLIKAAGVTAE